jgi:SHS2 domain-containing protein
MKRYELIEHTADIGIKAGGNTLAEAFANTACGLFEIMTDIARVRESESRAVAITGLDLENLLFNWINELIYIFDVEHMLFRRFDITDMTERSLKADCYGEKYDPDIHELKLGVKSATFYMLIVDPKQNRVQVILDV